MTHFLIFILLMISYLGYTYCASKFNIIDKPNERGSHLHSTIRGGGIIFPMAAVFGFLFFDYPYPFVFAGLLSIAVISFLDDLLTLSISLRIFFHVLAVTLIFIQHSFFDYSWYYWLPAYIAFIGWINAFNFMDGINGITSLYSLVCFGTFLYVFHETNVLSPDILIALSVSVLIFAFFNTRKHAKAFAGDVGSVSLAFLLGWFMLYLILVTQRFEYILFFLIYGIDSVFTILHRLITKKNIFMAHRSHLYQYLSNELNLSHVFVASLYAVLQLGINVLVLFLFLNGSMNPIVFILILLVFSVVYLIIRIKVLAQVKVRVDN